MWYNPIVTFVLRSPLHFTVSGLFLLITVTGRKSGRTYTTPVQYKQADRSLKFVTRRGRAWWRNLRGGAPVTVELRGRRLAGRAEIVAGDDEFVAGEIRAVYAPMVSEAQARALAPEAVVVRIDLNGAGA